MAVAVGLGVCVAVAVAVGVNVAVAVAVGDGVCVAVAVAGAVGVGVNVAVAVGVGVNVAVAVGVAVGDAVGVGVGVPQPCKVLLSTTLMEVASVLLYPATTTALCPPAVFTVAASANERAELRVGPVLQLLATGS